MKIPVVDIFAGPGGLGEGFNAYSHNNQNIFETCLSIEKDPFAFRTLRLRAFFRKIPFNELKESYIEFAKSDKTLKDEEKLFSNFKDAKRKSEWEVLCKELGSQSFPQCEIDSIIQDHLNSNRCWVLIGGPPCQAYSLVGRSRMSHLRRNNLEQFENDERHYLYQHYLSILAKHKPPFFVFENVKGLLSSTLKGQLIINQIINDLRDPSGKQELGYRLFSFVQQPRGWEIFGDPKYKISDYIIYAEDYNVPQKRHRVIILGIRSDIKLVPEPLKKGNVISVKKVISDLAPLRSQISFRGDRGIKWSDHIREINSVLLNGHLPEKLHNKIIFMLGDLFENAPTKGNWFSYKAGRPNKIIKEWFRRQDLGGVTNHEARSHMPMDLQRYFFASCFAQVRNGSGPPKSPVLSDFPKELLPVHKNVNSKNIKEASFDDRFRVQIWNLPATTITSHIAKDGHYYIHPDPRQCRSLSVREAARIQTFQDNYIFLGPKTYQYQQVGNAVPPLLALQLAEVVYDLISQWIQKNNG